MLAVPKCKVKMSASEKKKSEQGQLVRHFLHKT